MFTEWMVWMKLQTQIKPCVNTDGEIRNYYIEPEEFRDPKIHKKDLAGGNAEENAEILIRILQGEKSPKRDIVLLKCRRRHLYREKKRILFLKALKLPER